MNIFIPFLVFLLKKWKLLSLNLVICIALAVVYSFFIAKKQFMCSTTFIPNSASKSILSLAQLGISDLDNGSDVSPDQIKILFGSVTLRKQIIENFNYYKKLNLENSPNPLKLALKAINKDLVLETTEKGSLGVTEILSFNIKCYHSSPDTAYQITQYAYSYLDSIITKISTSKASETKKFIHNQLLVAENNLDSLQKDLNSFQKQNKAYEIPEQLKLTIKAFGDLKAQYLLNEIKIKSLSKEMQTNSPELLNLKKENSVLSEKMNSLEVNNGKDVLISLNKYSDLLPRFTNLLREVETQTRLVAFLTQQYEEAKIKETKDISSLIVIDKPLLPQYKERPKRVFLMAQIFAIYYSMFLAIMTLYFLFHNYFKKSSFYNEFIESFSKQ